VLTLALLLVRELSAPVPAIDLSLFRDPVFASGTIVGAIMFAMLLAMTFLLPVFMQEMLGFEYANVPDWPVTGRDTLRLGTERIWFIHPGAAHSAGDLMLWLPGERILFSGDVLMGDGVTMVVDGSSGAMLAALDLIDSLKPKIIVPGHGPIERDPAALTGRTRQYLTDLRGAMGRALDQGLTLRKAIETLPPPDSDRPVSLASRKRRNAVTVYLELERAKMGLDQ